MSNFSKKYDYFLKIFNDALNKYKSNLINAPESLISAMTYSLDAGGKRIRPILFLATIDALGGNVEKYADFSVLYELIHTYSLIHDDLPAIDNDDYRRGKPTNHKVYGEALAILAGDALLNSAYEYGLKLVADNINLLKPLKLLAECCGYSGMIGGQAVDVSLDKTSDCLNYIHLNKTAKMIIAPVKGAALALESTFAEQLGNYAENLGLLFQITDDILDEIGDEDKVGKKLHKDLENNKLTAISVYGLEGARELAINAYNNCKTLLQDIPNNAFLMEYTDKIFSRNK